MQLHTLARDCEKSPAHCVRGPLCQRGLIITHLDKGGRRAAAGGFADVSWQSRRMDSTDAINGSEHWILLTVRSAPDGLFEAMERQR